MKLSLYGKLCLFTLFANSLMASTKTYDFIVVGGGTAGCHMARRLSDNFKKKVLLVNKGLPLINDPRILNPNVFSELPQLVASKDLAQCTLVPDQFNGIAMTEAYSSGIPLGGSSAHNFLASVRGTFDIYTDLVATSGGNQNWTLTNVLNAFIVDETFTNFAGIKPNVERGTSGPVFVTGTFGVDPTTIPFFNTIVNPAWGIPSLLDYNLTNTPVGTVVAQQFLTPTVSPTRSYSLNAFLTPGVIINEVPNRCGELHGIDGRQLEILTESNVTKVILKGKRATGIEYYDKFGKCRTATANCAVVLSAGCPFSAQILQLSGIGKEEVLSSVGVNTCINNPLVGDNLHVHFGVDALFKNGTNDIIFPAASLAAFVDGASLPSSPYSAGVRRFEMVMVQTNALPAPFSHLNAFDPEIFSVYFSNLSPNPLPISPGDNLLYMLGWNLRPSAPGSAFIVSSSPSTWPQILYNFYQDVLVNPLSDPNSDASKSVAMFKLFKQLEIEAGPGRLELVYPPAEHFSAPFGPAPDDSQLFEDARAVLLNSILTVTNHYTGTCQIGVPGTGVVDGNGLVIGSKNLYVADTSIYPQPPTGNTCLSAYLAAEIIGQAIIKRFN